MTKFNNLKVKRVKSNLKYTKSKLVKKRPPQKEEILKKPPSYRYHAEKGSTVKGITLKGNTQRHHAKSQHAKRHHAEASRKEPTRKKATHVARLGRET